MADISSSFNSSTGSPLRRGSAGQKKASSMADLMASYKTSFQTFHKSDAVKGKIVKLTKNEILVDIQAKSLAVVLEKDRSMLNSILNSLHTGDTVEVTILNPESEMGNPVVSLRRFMSNAAWLKLEEARIAEKQLDVQVTDLTKGGLVVSTVSGLSGFLPNSHLAGGQLSVGKQAKVRVIEVNRADNKIIFSQKVTISAVMFDDAIKQFNLGGTVEATVMNIVPFGVFVTIPVPGKKNSEGAELMLDGLIHISEISWEKVEEISQQFTSGQKISVKIIGFDKNTRRADLSIKQLSEDPFEKLLAAYPVDKKVTAQITKLDENGAHLLLDAGVAGIIRKDKIPPTVVFTQGQTISATVSEVDKKRRKIYLVPVLLEKPIGYR